MGLFDGDVGWAGAYTPMVVSTNGLEELRNLAGPPQYPGAKWVMVDLASGEFKWYSSQSKGRSNARRGRRR